MTNEEVSNSMNEIYNGFWVKYRDRQPDVDTPEWERMMTAYAVLTKKYPLMAEVINRMATEIIERSRGRGNKPGEFHKPPRREGGI